MSNISFPNESPAYRRARAKLLEAEIALRQQVAVLAALRRALPPGGEVPQDYEFQRFDAHGNIEDVALSSLFARGKKSLLIYDFMYGPDMQKPCVMCSSMLDALNGNARQISERINLAIVARSPIERIVAFAKKRGWHNLTILSSANNTFQRDYFGETEGGDQLPMANVFVKEDKLVRHFWGSEMLYAGLDGQPRHVDLLWPLWNAFDLTPEGRGTDWYPSV